MIKLMRILVLIALASAIYRAAPTLTVQFAAFLFFFVLPVVCLLKVALGTKKLRFSPPSFTKRR
jgi:hypothetical protein